MTYQQLTQEQRYMIYVLRQEGYNQSRIARAIGVHKSTISRELRRNIYRKGYRPKMAHRLAVKRRRISRKPIILTPHKKCQIRSYMRKKWSPEQIAGWLRKTNRLTISHETIYKYIRRDKIEGGSLYKHLRRKRKYRKRYTRTRRGPLQGRISIDQRPSVVDQKSRLGDWEVDTIFSGTGRSALITAVERVSKYCAMCQVPDKTQDTISSYLPKLLSPYKQLVHTITSDNGVEFAGHKYIANELDADFYFAHPYSSWERGLNENTNGLIRQYLPKRTSFENLSRKEVSSIMFELNRRPRKTLGYRTPVEVLYDSVALEG